MHGRGFFGNGCLGYGFAGGYFWHTLISIGIVLFIAAIVIYFIKRGTKKNANSQVLESLKVKFVQGEITEEEYMRRKEVIKKI